MPIINETIISGVNAKDATASSADILQCKTAVVGKELITGTMPEKSGLIVDGTFDSGATGYITGKIAQEGHYATTSKLKIPVANLSAGNIRKGVTIGGVSGTLSPTNVIVQQGITSFSLTVVNNGTSGVNFRLAKGNSLPVGSTEYVNKGVTKSYGTISGQVVGLSQTSNDAGFGAISSATVSGGSRISASYSSGYVDRTLLIVATSQNVTITL